MRTSRRATAVYLRFLVGALSATILVAIVGALPMRKLAGADGLIAMLVGCAVALSAAAIAAVPLSRALVDTNSQARLVGLLVAMSVRFGVVLAAVLVLVRAGWYLRNPLLMGVAFSYLAVLAIETRFAVAALSQESSK